MPKRPPRITATEQEDAKISRVTREKREGEAAGEQRNKLDGAFDEARRYPLRVARQVRDRLATSKAEYEAALYLEIALAYAAAVALSDKSLHWTAFVQDEFWGSYSGHKPKLHKPGDYLRWMMIFVFRVEDEQGLARANTYRGALAELFERRVDPQLVVEHLQKGGGIEVLYRDSLPSARPTRPTDAPEPPQDAAKPKKAAIPEDDHSVAGDDEPTREELNPASKNLKVKQAPTLMQRAKAIRERGMVAVLIAMTEDDWEQAKHKHLRRGRATLDLRLGGDTESGIELDCEKIYRALA